MSHTIREVAAALGAEAAGDLDLTVESASEPATARADQLALATDPKYADGIRAGKAQAALVWVGADWQSFGLKAAIFAPRGRLAMAGLTQLFDAGPDIPAGVHALAIIDPTAQIGTGAAIGPFTIVGAQAQIGKNARIASHVTIGQGAVIGDDALILEGVKIGARVKIGDRFIAQPGAVIGSDGFSFVTPEKSGVEEARQTLGHRETITRQSWVRIHSLGSVSIGDDVEVGANTTIDRGTIRDTSIGSGTKLDNLVHVAHNVQVGRDCLLCAQVGIAGSSKIGDRVVLAGQVGVSDNIFVGDDVITGGASKLFSNVPAGRIVWGFPAVKMDTYLEMQKALRRLPRKAASGENRQKPVSNSDDNT